MKISAMRKHFEQRGYTEYADLIESQARRCVRFQMIPTEESGLATGCSRAGGSPDLPPDYSWPSFQGRPLDFIIQINLEDVAGSPYCKELPEKGLLSVFYNAVGQPWGFDPKHRRQWKILYIPEPELGLERRAFPEGGTFWKFRTCAPEFHEALQSGWTNIPIEELSLDDEDEKAFRNFVYSLPHEPAHQILGSTDGIQSSEEEMQRQCQWVSSGLYLGGSGGPAFDKKRAEELEPGAAEWRLLLHLASDENAAMEWGDFGQLYFWIRDEDLRQRDFSAVWVILECM